MSRILKYIMTWRVYISAALICSSLINMLFGYFGGSLDKGAIVFVVSGSFICVLLIIQFLYGKSMIFGGAVYPNDGSLGRPIIASLLFIVYVLVQIFAYFLS